MTDLPPEQRHLWEFQWVRDAAALTALIGTVWLGYKLSLVTVPLLAALGLAYLIEPLLAWLQRQMPRLGRRGALVAVIGSALAVLALVVILTVPPLVRQTVGLAQDIPRHARTLSAWSQQAERPAWLREHLAPLANLTRPTSTATLEPGPSTGSTGDPPASNSLDEARVRAVVREELAHPQPTESGDWLERIREAGATLASAAAGFLGNLAQIGIGLGVGAFAFVSFSSNWPRVVTALHDLIPAARRPRTLHLVGRLDRVVSSFVRGRLTIAAMVGVMYAIGWTLCGVPYGLLLGLAIGVASVVPYLAAIGLPLAWLLLAVPLLGATDPASSWYLTAGADGVAQIVLWKVLLFPALVNFITQSTEDYVLTPLIQGKATDLHPVAIMVAVIAGGSLMGLYGMLLAVPVAACVRILGEEVLIPRLRRWAERAAGT
jgi:predicted PurR-regulated permease PerM